MAVELGSLIAEEERIQKKLTNFIEWKRLNNQIFVAKGSKGSGKIINDIENHPFVRNNGPCLSSKAKIQRITLNEKLIGFHRLDQVGRIPFLKEIIVEISENPQLLECASILERYLFAAYNLGLLGIIFGEADSIEYAFAQLQSLPKTKTDTKILVFERLTLLRLELDLSNEDFKNARKNASLALSGLKKYGRQLSPKHHLEIRLQLCHFYFKIGEWNKIVKLTFDCINASPIQENAQLVSLLWINFCVAQVELGNAEIAQKYSKYATKYLARYNLFSEISNSIFESLKQIASSINSSLPKKEKERITRIATRNLKSEDGKFFESYIPISAWIRASVEKRG